MKTTFLKTIPLIICIGIHLYVTGQTPDNDASWQLLFEDEFTDSNTFLSKGWCSGYFCSNSHLHCKADPPICERQVFEKYNIVYNPGGGLSLKSRKETVTRRENPWKSDTLIMCDGKPNLREFYYTSGAISSATGRFSYGYFEIKCKVPKGSAYWPAFWLWYSEQGIGQEIDILEVSGENSVQCTTYSSNVYMDPNLKSKGVITTSIDLSQEYHTYAAEWTPHSVIFYRDNQQTRVVKGDTVPYIPLKVCINLSISPWPPPVINPFTGKSFDIEYVKIYTLQTDCDSIIIRDNFDFTTHFYSLKKSYQLSNSVVPVGFPVTIRATDEIELQEGFEVPLGAEFCAMITECH